MNRAPLRDLLIFLPGIMGSSLRIDGRDVWALSGQAISTFFRTSPQIGADLKRLKMRDDDCEIDDLEDGITPGDVIRGDTLVAPLVKLGGYRPVIEAIQAEFSGVVEGSAHAPQPGANFFPFPYDWRRDNRANARRLERFISAQLPAWKAHSGAKDARVILVAHSMGGLVARYYAEVLGGWKDCKLLVTIGTPHRGSMNAVQTLLYGIKKFPILSNIARELTSIYQLLPTYKAVVQGGTGLRLPETELLPQIEIDRRRIAYNDFVLAIETAAQANRQLAGYEHFVTIPWVGVHQDTLQSILIDDGAPVLSYALPPDLSPAFAGGDGTVPQLTAVPGDFSDAERNLRARFSDQQHGWLTNNPMSLTTILQSLGYYLAPGTRNALGEAGHTVPSVSLQLHINEPVLDAGEPVLITLGLRGSTKPLRVKVRVTPVDSGQTAGMKHEVFIDTSERVQVSFDGLPAGLYRVRAGVGGSIATQESLFEVVDPLALEYAAE